ncbi:MAG: alpha/beta hydrolase [Flavobacteriales bacterium]|nr:alpha/beta hydrolase [Flavobacteriales bacterium]
MVLIKNEDKVKSQLVFKGIFHREYYAAHCMSGRSTILHDFSMIQKPNVLHYETHLKSEDSEWLLMIHGAGGSTRTWKRQIKRLSQHFNLLVIDLPGHGLSALQPSKDDEYTFSVISHRVWEVVDHLKIDQVHVLGVSLGAIIALRVEQLYNHRVKSVVLAGAIVQLNRKLKIIASTSLFLAKLIGYRAFYKIAARIALPRKNHKTSRDVFIRESAFLTTDEFRKWTEMYRSLNITLKELYTEATNAPRLLLMGDQDHLFLNPAMEYVKRRANSILKVFPKCGHVVNIEQAEAFNEQCIEFIHEVTGRGPIPDLSLEKG